MLAVRLLYTVVPFLILRGVLSHLQLYRYLYHCSWVLIAFTTSLTQPSLFFIHIQTASSYAELTSDPDVVIVDVRTPSEFACAARKHVPGAVNMPVAELTKLLPTADPSKRYVLYCVAGYRSAIATSLFQHAGLNAVDVPGGLVLSILPQLIASGVVSVL